MPDTKTPLPRHVAIIMDGNNRWARNNHKTVFEGYQAGLDALEKNLLILDREGIRYVSLYAFSTENWQRPVEEVSFLMRLMEKAIRTWRGRLETHQYRLRLLGDLTRLPASISKDVQALAEATSHHTGLTVLLALSYGGRDEILRAAQRLARDHQVSGKTLSEYSEEDFSNFLDTSGIPDPDLLIRSGGDLRISNFLLWQAAYCEFVFLDEYWPNIGEEHMKQALDSYKSRKRHFGTRKIMTSAMKTK